MEMGILLQLLIAKCHFQYNEFLLKIQGPLQILPLIQKKDRAWDRPDTEKGQILGKFHSEGKAVLQPFPGIGLYPPQQSPRADPPETVSPLTRETFP